MVESLDSALARIDPIDLVWLIGGVVLAAFMRARYDRLPCDFEYRERGRKARRRGSRVFKRYPNPEAVFSQMLRDLGFSARVDELKIELKRLPAIKKARKLR